MNVVIDHDLDAEIGVIRKGNAKQYQQDAVERAGDEFDHDRVLKAAETIQRSGQPKAEKNQHHCTDTLGQKMSSRRTHCSNQKAMVNPNASTITNQADAFA